MRKKFPLFNSLIFGAVEGVGCVAGDLSYAFLFFSGSMALGAGLAYNLFILGSILLTLIVALRSKLTNILAGHQEVSIGVLSAAISSMSLKLAATPEQKVMTALAILGTASILTGTLFWIFGRFKIGVFANYIPFPVLAGFLAGTGWLLVHASIEISTGTSQLLPFLQQLGSHDVLLRFAPSLIFAILLYCLLQRFPNPYTLPIFVVVSISFFYFILWVFGMNLEAATSHGHLPLIDQTSGSLVINSQLIKQIHWEAVLQALPAIISAASLSLLAILLNLKSLEMETGDIIDSNSELLSTGIANILGGSFGSLSGFVMLSSSRFARLSGLYGRIAAFSALPFILLGLVFSKTLVTHVPVFFTAGFILFFGIDFIVDWLFSTFKRLQLFEWLIILGIFITVIFIGFMEALALGTLVSIIVFVINYSRLPVVRKQLSGDKIRSKVERAPHLSAELNRAAKSVLLLQLQGYIFFGRTDGIIQHVRQRLGEKETDPLRFLILDFLHVSGIDSAAVNSFKGIQSLLKDESVHILFTSVSKEIEVTLKLSGISFVMDSIFSLENDVDHALEKIEELLITDLTEFNKQEELIEYLRARVGNHPRLGDFLSNLEEVSCSANTTIIVAGDNSNSCYCVKSGRLSLQLAQTDGKQIRVLSFSTGVFFGMSWLYNNPRSVNVIAEVPSVVLKLSAEKLKSIETDDPHLAIFIHRLLATDLSMKLAQVDHILQENMV